jgi:hypothetical protein
MKCRLRDFDRRGPHQEVAVTSGGLKISPEGMKLAEPGTDIL